ncbi:MAG: hypothetical protein GY757_55550 [bacterium]|nr:hypothetical protein [bacterium]
MAEQKWEIWYRTKKEVTPAFPDSHDWKPYRTLKPVDEETIDGYLDNLSKSDFASWLEFEKREVVK